MKVNRQSGFTAIALAAVLLACAAAHAEQFLNAHYEIDIVGHNSESRLKSTFQLMPGKTATIELMPNTVKFSVMPISDKEYDLQMVISPQRQPGVVLLDKTFRGQFGVPLELRADGDAVKVTGAISVVVLQAQDPPPEKPAPPTGKSLQA
jgi:hypothetical protein